MEYLKYIFQIAYIETGNFFIYAFSMEIKELEERLNKRHVKVKVPTIRASSYEASYRKLLRTFALEVVSGFSNLVLKLFKEKNSKKVLDEVPNSIKPSAFIEEDYSSALDMLFDYYDEKADKLARDYSDKELANLYAYIYGAYKSKFPNMSISSEYYKSIMGAVVNENLALIKSIPEEILKNMKVILSESVISGNQKELIKEISRIKDITRDRAVFIAQDQVHKAIEGFKQVQNVSLGIEYYEWRTAEDERVSTGPGGHYRNNRRIFKYGSNEAIISYSNKRGFYYGKPGDRPRCRCTAIGVVLDTDERIKKAPDGYGYVIEKVKS